MGSDFFISSIGHKPIGIKLLPFPINSGTNKINKLCKKTTIPNYTMRRGPV